MSENSIFKPTPEHKWLTRNIGEWAVKCSYYTIPGDDPFEVEGREVNEMLGDYWVIGRFEADLMGTPLIGQSMTGYDPVKKLYVGSWKDNHTPFHYTFDGKLNDSESELFLSGENYDPTRQRLSTYQSCMEYVSDSERVLSLSVLVRGEDVPILEYHYKRV